jgi:hypothetical protein
MSPGCKRYSCAIAGQENPITRAAINHDLAVENIEDFVRRRSIAGLHSVTSAGVLFKDPCRRVEIYAL